MARKKAEDTVVNSAEIAAPIEDNMEFEIDEMNPSEDNTADESEDEADESGAESDEENAMDETEEAVQEAFDQAEETAATKKTDTEESKAEKTAARQSNLVRAGKRAKRRLYRQDEVLTEDGFVKRNITNSQRHAEYMELVHSLRGDGSRGRKILKGRLLGSHEEGERIMAEIKYGENWMIYIPAEELIDLSTQDQNALRLRGIQDFYKDVINRRTGATTTFLVRYIDEKKAFAYGSHIDAMAIQAREYYTVPINSDRIPTIVKDMLVKTHVIQVNEIGIYVDVFGAETFINKTELSYNRVGDVNELYLVGDEVIVKILDITKHKIITPNREVNSVKVEASVKQTEINPNEKYFNQIQEGGKGAAVVNQITEDGIFVTYKEMVSVRCRFSGTGDIPCIGDRCMIRLDRKYEDGFKYEGTYIRKLG